MKGRNEVKMKHLPQVAISWEAAAAFSLFCFSLGAALSVLVMRRRREKRDAAEVIEFRTISERNSTGKQNTEKAEATGAKPLEALARNLPGAILSSCTGLTLRPAPKLITGENLFLCAARREA